VSFINDRNTVQRIRAKRPHRVGATVHARPETLAQAISRGGGGGVGIVIDSGKSYAPFDSLTQYEQYAKDYDGKALGRIARALREPEIKAHLTHDNGTAPELHVGGFWLQHGLQLGAELFFQDINLYGFRRLHRVFTADLGIWWNGLKVLLPVNGDYFHERLNIERVNDETTFNELKSRGLGDVLPIPGDVCFQGDTLDAFFTMHLGMGV
jgi:hypothetical protein